MAEKLSDGADLFKEELETLQSIYMGNDSFKIINEHSLTYKFSPEGSKDFIVQFEICPDYPDEAPNMHMDLLYNVNIGNGLKSAIVAALQSEARQYLGVQMMYSLLEWGSDFLGEVVASYQDESNEPETKLETAPHQPKEKKEILTKAAKKKLSDGADLFEEELETLQSIYMGNDSFKIINEHSLTYKFSPEGSKDFIVQFEICPDYPDEAPNMHMDLLYNVNIGNGLKSAIVDALQSEARQYLGVQMMYSLLEWGSDFLGEVVASYQDESNEPEPKLETAPHQPKEKKEILTKAAKKKRADRTDAKGEYPRGWNWVDVIKHLSKSGSSQDPN